MATLHSQLFLWSSSPHAQVLMKCTVTYLPDILHCRTFPSCLGTDLGHICPQPRSHTLLNRRNRCSLYASAIFRLPRSPTQARLAYSSTLIMRNNSIPPSTTGLEDVDYNFSFAGHLRYDVSTSASCPFTPRNHHNIIVKYVTFVRYFP